MTQEFEFGGIMYVLQDIPTIYYEDVCVGQVSSNGEFTINNTVYVLQNRLVYYNDVCIGRVSYEGEFIINGTTYVLRSGTFYYDNVCAGHVSYSGAFIINGNGNIGGRL